MKRELQSVKTALGPWYRPDGVYRPPVPSVSSEQPPDVQSSSSSSSHRHSMLEAISRLPVGPHELFTPPATANPDILAPYFPPATEEPSLHQSERQQHQIQNLRPTHRHSASIHFSDHGLHLQSHPHATHSIYPRALSQTQASIAPINLGTTLEGSLSSLRESIVTLSASVDSLARQHDLALTNETLKMNEEMMSLRASVHGLRMQASRSSLAAETSQTLPATLAIIHYLGTHHHDGPKRASNGSHERSTYFMGRAAWVHRQWWVAAFAFLHAPSTGLALHYKTVGCTHGMACLSGYATRTFSPCVINVKSPYCIELFYWFLLLPHGSSAFGGGGGEKRAPCSGTL